MSIVRVEKNSNYSVISNVHLQDQSISWKAKGILSYLLSKPDAWQIYISHLKNQSADGRDATRSGINELIDAGYITREYSRNSSGQIIGRDYVVHESPVKEKEEPERPDNKHSEPRTENPTSVDPTLEDPTTVNPPLLNTDNINNGLKTNNDDVQCPSSPLFELIKLIPKKFYKHSIRSLILKSFNAHGEAYTNKAIHFAINTTKAQKWTEFKAYLGKCIDEGWADGWEPEDPGLSKDEKLKKFLASRRLLPNDHLKIDAQDGCEASMQVLKERGVQLE